ncbi:2-phospho-L-lactate transferase [Georgenia deserti]|uniref:2-phospho-L-lactate transferase n=1 Tax=Georgenia deserti TaxID=2093781 RepID=A0ABW4L3L3_9MICO
MHKSPSVTLLAGGVGGARLAHGLAGALAQPEDLTVVGNTGDDDVIYGLHVSPDLDTVMYTLAGIADPQAGWGVAGDTTATLETLGRLGVPTWFRVGDQDFATHIARTARLRAGEPLSEVTDALRAALGVRSRLLPMSDQPVATRIETAEGTLDFQEYFVARRHRDPVRAVTFDGVDEAAPAPGVLDAIYSADVLVLAPSNPFVSIAPILAVPGVQDALTTTQARRVGVSPIVGGRAIKGPAAAMLEAMGHEVSALGVARLWADILDVLAIDSVDAHLAPAIEELGLRPLVTGTVMGDQLDRERLARELIA